MRRAASSASGFRPRPALRVTPRASAKTSKYRSFTCTSSRTSFQFQPGSSVNPANPQVSNSSHAFSAKNARSARNRASSSASLPRRFSSPSRSTHRTKISVSPLYRRTICARRSTFIAAPTPRSTGFSQTRTRVLGLPMDRKSDSNSGFKMNLSLRESSGMRKTFIPRPPRRSLPRRRACLPSSRTRAMAPAPGLAAGPARWERRQAGG